MIWYRTSGKRHAVSIPSKKDVSHTNHTGYDGWFWCPAVLCSFGSVDARLRQPAGFDARSTTLNESRSRRLNEFVLPHNSGGVCEAAAMSEQAEDILSDALTIMGGEAVEDPGHVQYGPLILTVAPKEGKANTLLADHLFSPALVLAELIELGVLPVSGCRIVELGAGCALPSLLAATMPHPPSSIVTTDYPDNGILGNLAANVERNRPHYQAPCRVHCAGYEWGTDTAPLLALSSQRDSMVQGYDVVIMSDLLHFDMSHGVLVSALTSLLAKSEHARVYVAAGKYTAPHVCARFLDLGAEAGMTWQEGTRGEDDDTWRGAMVRGLDAAQLGVRKQMCRWWVGQWSSGAVEQR